MPRRDIITPKDVLRYKAPTRGFLCPLSANTYDIDFLRFSISNYDTKKVFFSVDKSNPSKTLYNSDEDTEELFNRAVLSEDAMRTIKYCFDVEVLKTEMIATNLVFSVGSQEVDEFRLIERHYFRDKLVKSYDFNFGFCIPNSVNTWEAIYSVPLLEEEIVEEMINNPYQTVSDSFYFVANELVIHNKAVYRYQEPSVSKMRRKRSPKSTGRLSETKSREEKEAPNLVEAKEEKTSRSSSPRNRRSPRIQGRGKGEAKVSL